MPGTEPPRDPDCVFCQIIAGETHAAIAFQDETAIAFLDTRPLFHGHLLLVPRLHHETLTDLPPEGVEPLFAAARLLAGVVEVAMDAKGTFVAMNNKVSQSVPHLHIHIVPRRPKDGLKGFFWPRTKYESTDQMAEVAARIAAALPDPPNPAS